MPNQLGACVLMSAVAVGCTHGAGFRPEPFPRPSTAPDRVSNSPPARDSLAVTATRLKGARYQQGGDTPSGFDCSGFTRLVFAHHGILLPRLTREQYRTGRARGGWRRTSG